LVLIAPKVKRKPPCFFHRKIGGLMPDITEIDMYDLQKLCRQYGLDIDVLNADLWDLRKELRWAGCKEVD